MNPELPQVRSSNEAMPQIPGGVEYFPDGEVRSPELAQQYEQQPAQVEQLTQAAQAMPQMPAVPADSVVVVTPGRAQQADDDMPQVAADDDLIEKEWVDKLKKIINLTKGNPYEQAKAVAALQADYLKKRYDRVIGKGSE